MKFIIKFEIDKCNPITEERVINSITFDYYDETRTLFFTNFSSTLFITFSYTSKQYKLIFFYYNCINV